MLRIFEGINTLNSLKDILLEKENNKDQILTNKLEFYASKLYNISNASQVVTEWINILIDEYNSRYNNFNLVERSIHNRCLYNTIDFFIPFFGTYEKMGALINMCSLADDEDDANMDLHQEFFESSVLNATKYESEIHFLDIANDGSVDNGNDLLYLLGFFNFRIQNYNMAITYLEPCVEYRLKEINNDESIRSYIKSIIYLAESYEYNKNDLANALKHLIGLDGNQLKEHLINSKIRVEISRYLIKNYPNITKGENSIQYINKIFNFFYNSSDDVPASYKVFQLKGINDSLKSFVHVTAHCLSEYAAECMTKVAKMNDKFRDEIRIYSLLQQISRFLIDWLVIQDDSYVTCQATIRAENDACPEAIDILIKRLKRFRNISDEELSATAKMEKAELQFYIFYFAEQELNINNNKDNLVSIFKGYGEEFLRFVEESKDTNALFHYLVIQFKYLLKKSANDILQRNESADYTELDKIYYQIIECCKKPLPHVFQELIQESNRLVEAYLLLREYRYLDKEKPDLCNAQEFYNRLELRRYNVMVDGKASKYEMPSKEELDSIDDEENDFEDGDSNVIKTFIDEIEIKKRILILAPVKAAPSCSSDFVPISQLYKIVPRKNTLSSIKSVHSNFQQVAVAHGKKKGINKVLQCNDIGLVKWVIYYDSAVNALFLYYNEQEYGNKGEMLRANLNKNEKGHLDNLFESLKRFFLRDKAQVECSQENHKEIYGSRDVCTTWLMKGDDVSKNNKLLEILIFSEFDFYSPTHSRKIDDGDDIMFSVDQQYVAKYKIVCFNKLPITKEKGICNYCIFNDEENIQSYAKNSPIISEQDNSYICVYGKRPVDLNKLKDNIMKKREELLIKGYHQNAKALTKLKDVYDEICECCDSGCKKDTNTTDCKLLGICVKNDVDIPV